jgi:hypothetical protein
MFARLCAQTRLRRWNWWTRPANALRFRLDTVGGRGCVYSFGGPGWARGQLLTNSHSGMVLSRFGIVPLHLLTPKGMSIPPDEGRETSRGSAGWSDDRTWPGEASPEGSRGL